MHSNTVHVFSTPHLQCTPVSLTGFGNISKHIAVEPDPEDENASAGKDEDESEDANPPVQDEVLL